MIGPFQGFFGEISENQPRESECRRTLGIAIRDMHEAEDADKSELHNPKTFRQDTYINFF